MKLLKEIKLDSGEKIIERMRPPKRVFFYYLFKVAFVFYGTLCLLGIIVFFVASPPFDIDMPPFFIALSIILIFPTLFIALPHYKMVFYWLTTKKITIRQLSWKTWPPVFLSEIIDIRFGNLQKMIISQGFLEKLFKIKHIKLILKEPVFSWDAPSIYSKSNKFTIRVESPERLKRKIEKMKG